MIANRRVCDFAFFTSSGGKFYEFFMTVALAIPPHLVKNRPSAIIWACALNRKNTVMLEALMFWIECVNILVGHANLCSDRAPTRQLEKRYIHLTKLWRWHQKDSIKEVKF